MSGQNYDVKRENGSQNRSLPAVARDQGVQLKVARCCRWNLSAFFKISFCFVLLYNKSLNDWSLREQLILFSENLNVSGDEPRDQS